jgi:2-alkenal reductase
MSRNRLWVTAGGGCVLLLVLAVVAVFLVFTSLLPAFTDLEQPGVVVEREARPVVEPLPTLTLVPGARQSGQPAPAPDLPQLPAGQPVSLTSLYKQLNPGVVSIQVYIEQGLQAGQGAGSGFILDEQGHIVTNHHVIAGGRAVTVVFFNGLEREAEVIGTDPDSDLAVLRVEALPENVHPLPLGNSQTVQVGEWVVAIGNPFQLGGSMSVGVVSAIGRTIPSGATPYSIPQAIQTDAAINPGNSGGPLLNLNGEVIGVNAQILTRGTPANAGVGFAIPSNVVRQVVPTMIEQGYYSWPWLGATGGSVTLAVAQANNLDFPYGAYIQEVIPGSPAAEAGLRGSSGAVELARVTVPVGGDVVIEVDGEPILDFADLLARITSKAPGEAMEVTVVRRGETIELTVILAARPDNVGP